MNKWKSMLAVAFSLGLLSCTVKNKNSTEIPRDSFIYIEQHAQYIVCDISKVPKLECAPSTPRWTASGVLVGKDKKNDKSYILTAAHVCDGAKAQLPYIIISRSEQLYGYTLEGRKHSGKIIAMDDRYDLCLMEIEYVDNKVSKISKEEPEPGDRLFNAAAPTGTWYPNTIILLEGFYSGTRGTDIITSIPAAGGSSGSPIFNSQGEIVGILHSVNTRFNNISIATRLRYVRKFLKEHLPGF